MLRGYLQIFLRAPNLSLLKFTNISTVPTVSEPERELLFSNFGKSDDASVAAVKELYDKLDVRQKYLDYSCEVYKNVCQDIEEDKSGLPANIFQDFLDKIHKRSK